MEDALDGVGVNQHIEKTEKEPNTERYLDATMHTHTQGVNDPFCMCVCVLYFFPSTHTLRSTGSSNGDIGYTNCGRHYIVSGLGIDLENPPVLGVTFKLALHYPHLYVVLGCRVTSLSFSRPPLLTIIIV